MRHLSADELQRWWKDGAPEDRARVVDHLAECDECAGLYDHLIDEQPIEAAPARPDLARAGYSAYRPAAPRSATRAGLWLGGLAAAAAILLVVFLAPRDQPETVFDTLANDTLRATTIQAISPTGMATLPVVFAWSSPIEAGSYELVVYDASGATLWRGTVGGTRFEATADLLQRLGPGTAYSWQVTAINARGEPTIGSTRQAFRVAPPGR